MTEMQAYLVRLKHNSELVGLFVSKSDSELEHHVDECCDPHECEFLRLPSGGIYRGEARAPTVPTLITDPENEDLYPDWFARAAVSERWLDAFYGQASDQEWEPVRPQVAS